jgi:hypothetical protein
MVGNFMQFLLGAAERAGDHVVHTLVMQTYLATIGTELAGFL